MNKTMYNKLPLSFLKGRKAVVLRDINSRGGEVIKEGEIVEIQDKFGGFAVQSVETNIYIRKVNCEYIDLID